MSSSYMLTILWQRCTSGVWRQICYGLFITLLWSLSCIMATLQPRGLGRKVLGFKAMRFKNHISWLWRLQCRSAEFTKKFESPVACHTVHPINAKVSKLSPTALWVATVNNLIITVCTLCISFLPDHTFTIYPTVSLSIWWSGLQSMKALVTINLSIF